MSFPVKCEKKNSGICIANEPTSADDNKKLNETKKTFCSPHSQKTLMSRQKNKNDSVKCQERGEFYPATRRIPVQFAADVPVHYPVKVRPQYFMSMFTVTTNKPLIPALFQMAALADDPKVLPALRNALGTGLLLQDEAVLDAGRLDAILKAIAKKRKPAARRFSAGRI